MRNIFVILSLVFSCTFLFGQESETNKQDQNSAEKILNREGSLMIGGYGEVHYNQSFDGDIRHNGKLDVHRMVLLMGYRFNERTQFVTEIEFEHVKEVYVEQAFLQYKVNSYLNLRGGLLLIPMGLINEYHEPTAFHGVERPLVDKYIVPSTWREIGVGVNGNLIGPSLKYQAYLVNGFNGYDGAALLDGKNGLRKGRQKGAESFISSPAFAARVEHYGLGALTFGLSAYIGKSQSSLYDGIERQDEEKIALADSSVVGIAMTAADFRFSKKALRIKGQFYYTALSNTEAYNQIGGKDLGNAHSGFYVEASYNVLNGIEGVKSSLFPFIRYEMLNTHQRVNESLEANPAYAKSIFTGGLSWFPSKGAVVKADLQYVSTKESESNDLIFNAGIGVMF